MKATAFFFSMLMAMLPSAVVSAQQKPTTGYAPVNGLKMYYEIHGEGDPVVLLHGAFMPSPTTGQLHGATERRTGSPNFPKHGK